MSHKLEEILKQYKYLTDEECYYNTYRQTPVTASYILEKLIKSGQPEAKAIEIMESMKDTGLLKSQLKKQKPSITSFLGQSYDTVKLSLGLSRLPTGGVEKLYAIDSTSQVTLCGDCDIDKFRSLIVSNPIAYAATKQEFEDGPRSATYQAKLSFKLFIDALYPHFLVDPDRVLKSLPALLSWSPLEPAFRVLDPNILKPGPTPNWDSFLSRVNFPEVFMAFVWNIFEPNNTGRQSLWIRGGGADGKSSVINAISAFLGRAYVQSIVKGAYEGRFFYSGAYGKRLSIYMDCKNPYILGSEKIKSMLGRDSVEIEKKFEHMYTAQLDNKLVILSNFFPKINYADKSERTRLIMIEVSSFISDDGDADFEYNLEAELPAFLVRCKAEYDKICPKDVNIHLPKAMIARIKAQCAGKEFELLEQFIAERLEIDVDTSLNKLEVEREMVEFLQKLGIRDKSIFLESAFTNLLLTKGVTVEMKGTVSIYKGLARKSQILPFKNK